MSWGLLLLLLLHGILLSTNLRGRGAAVVGAAAPEEGSSGAVPNVGPDGAEAKPVDVEEPAEPEGTEEGTEKPAEAQPRPREEEQATAFLEEGQEEQGTERHPQSFEDRVAQMERDLNAALHEKMSFLPPDEPAGAEAGEDDDDDYNDSLLEVLFEQGKDFAFSLTPGTDSECAFAWTRGRCEPKCMCRMDVKLGDYRPSRACRLVPEWQRDPTCEGRVHASDTALLVRLKQMMGRLGTLGVEGYRAIARPTDDECTFSFRTQRCQPADLCEWSFLWGDLTPSQSCRRRV